LSAGYSPRSGAKESRYPQNADENFLRALERYSMTFSAARRGRSLPQPFRYGAVVWLSIWVPAYWRVWGPANFVHLCDVAVFLTCFGLMTGNRLLISSQAVASLVVNAIWTLDAAFLVFANRPFFGGTQFLLDSRIPFWVRLLSLYHLLVPAVLLWALSYTSYDRRALVLQCGITLAALIVSRFTNPLENFNFAFRDPFWGRQLGPLPLHLAVSIVFVAAVAYTPAHLLLLHMFGFKKRSKSTAVRIPAVQERFRAPILRIIALVEQRFRTKVSNSDRASAQQG